MWAEWAKKVTKYTDVIHCIFYYFEQEKLICVCGLFKTLNLLKMWCSTCCSLVYFRWFCFTSGLKSGYLLFELRKLWYLFILDVISIVGICCNIDFKAAYFVPYRLKYQSAQINSLIWTRTYIPYHTIWTSDRNKR